MKLSPKKAVRAYCKHCVGGAGINDIIECDANDERCHICPIHPIRIGRGRVSVKIIRKFCLQCSGWSTRFVRECDVSGCAFHPFRLGKNPARKGIGRHMDNRTLNTGYSG